MKKALKIEDPVIGRRLHVLRVNLGYSMVELAKISALTQSQISSYENDKKLPTAPALAKLSRALETTVDYLLFGEESKPIKQLESSIFPDLHLEEQLKVKEFAEALFALRQMNFVKKNLNHSKV